MALCFALDGTEFGVFDYTPHDLIALFCFSVLFRMFNVCILQSFQYSKQRSII